jgi:hypothetical protein
MKYAIAFIFLLFVGLTTHAQMQEVSDKQVKFVNTFLDVVHSHNGKKTIKMMDKKYRKDQLAFLKGNTEQFLNELFSGEDLLSGEYVSIEFANILKIEVAEVIALKEGGFTYIFRIRDGQHDILSSLFLVATGKLGLVGASG